MANISKEHSENAKEHSDNAKEFSGKAKESSGNGKESSGNPKEFSDNAKEFSGNPKESSGKAKEISGNLNILYQRSSPFTSNRSLKKCINPRQNSILAGQALSHRGGQVPVGCRSMRLDFFVTFWGNAKKFEK